VKQREPTVHELFYAERNRANALLAALQQVRSDLHPQDEGNAALYGDVLATIDAALAKGKGE